MAIFLDMTRRPLKLKNFMHRSLVRLWLRLGLGGHFVLPTQSARNLIIRVYWTTFVQGYCLRRSPNT